MTKAKGSADDFKITSLKLDKIIPAKNNPREDLETNSPAFISISKSLEKFGLVEPIVIRNSNLRIISGHQRLKKIKMMVPKVTEFKRLSLGTISWLFIPDLVGVNSDADEIGLNIALNKVSGVWDDSQLEINIKALKELDFDLRDIGLSSMEIHAFTLDKDEGKEFERGMDQEEEGQCNDDRSNSGFGGGSDIDSIIAKGKQNQSNEKSGQTNHGTDDFIPPKDNNVRLKLSIHPAIWLSKRDEILGIIEKMI